MKAVFALIVVVHGMIHLMGFAKAFRYAEIAQLHESITRPAGVLWLLAALLFVASAFLLFAAPASLWGDSVEARMTTSTERNYLRVANLPSVH